MRVGNIKAVAAAQTLLKAESHQMAFRSHVMRSIDVSRRSNGLIIGFVVVSAIAGGVVLWTGGESRVLLAPVYTFALWALVRELDPDHDSTALFAAFAGGTWILAGLDPFGLAFTVGLVVAARLVLNSTGRRPLPTDLLGIVAIAAVVSFSTIGWAAGFSIAVAIYVDDRMADEQKTMSTVAAAAAALAASGVATLASVFPERVPDVVPELALAVGVLSLIAFVREPEPPTSLVDSRRRTPLSGARLHASRGLAGVAMFVAAILAGQQVETIGPVAIALSLALASNELERIRRKTK